MNIVQTIRNETLSLSTQTAVIQGPAQLTYGELLAAVDRIGQALCREGAAPGQRVAVIADDSIGCIVINLAVLAISAVVVPVSPSLSHSEVEELLRQMMVNFVISDRTQPFMSGAHLLAEDVPSLSGFRIMALAPSSEPPQEYAAMNPAFIRFSSGTTGASKGVLLSHESILDRTDAANKGLQMTSKDVVLWVLSMSFHFVVTILLFLRKGCTIVLCNADFPLSLIDGLTRHGGTFIYASPFHYHALVSSQTLSPDALSGIRMAVSTAMHLPADLARTFKDRFNFFLSSAYGIIEVGLPFINTSPDLDKCMSVGRVLPDYQIRIEKPNDDGIGEIHIRGKGLFDAYFSPWRPQSECLQDGWFRTGDLGRIDREGYLHIVGRDNAVINFAGMKVFPQEVEEVLNQYPMVMESLVYGVAHPQYGQLPVAKIILEPSVDGEFDTARLRRFCFERLAPYKVPKEFFLVDNLERTASNKLRRR